MKLNEFTDRLYAMSGIEQEKKKSRRLNESFMEDINGAMPMADNRHGLLKFNDKNWIKLGDGKEIKLLSSSKMIYDENKNKVLNSINCIVIFNDDTDYGEVYCQSISSDDFIHLVSQVKAMDKSQLLNFIEQNGGRIIYSRNRNGSGLDESYDYELFDDVCKEYSSLYPYDISLREVWSEIVHNYGDEDLANDVIDYLEGAFGDEEEYDDEYLYESQAKANIHLVQNMFDEAVKNGLYDEAKKIVENRGIKVDKNKLHNTPTSACTGAYIDLKKLLYK